MNFLVIAQDLRVSGTSEGIVSRSFIARLRQVFPDSFIKVVYLKHSKSNDELFLLPVNEIVVKQITVKLPIFLIWINKFFWRIFNISLNEIYKYRIYRKHLGEISYKEFDHVFIRSSGLEYETILGAKGLPILKKAIVNFHDPFPVFSGEGSKIKFSGLELFRFRRMQEVVNQCKACITPASYLSGELEKLYGSKKHFYTLPHQYEKSVFDLSDKKNVFKKKKRITLSYQGALQFGRNIEELLDVYRELVEHSGIIADETEFVARLRSSEFDRLKLKYRSVPNIRVLPSVNFSNSAYEQKHLVDINIILENGPVNCIVLLGKAPFLADTQKPVFILSPLRSELKKVVLDQNILATYGDKKEIKIKMTNLMLSVLNKTEIAVSPFGNYFSIKLFKGYLQNILTTE